MYELPLNYTTLSQAVRKAVREQYVEEQGGNCMHCECPLKVGPPEHIKVPIDWGLFPPNFLQYPVHLQHCHKTGMTEGAVHAYCNAVLWQYHGR